jgi:DNA topoisomerase-1
VKNLIIVESPTKAKTIKNFLGKDYTIIASKGHIRDLPKSSFGIKIENQTFTPEYRVPKDHASIVKELKDLAKVSDNVFIATDEDREGEAIGFHIATAIGKDPQSVPRIVFH